MQMDSLIQSNLSLHSLACHGLNPICHIMMDLESHQLYQVAQPWSHKASKMVLHTLVALSNSSAMSHLPGGLSQQSTCCIVASQQVKIPDPGRRRHSMPSPTQYQVQVPAALLVGCCSKPCLLVGHLSSFQFVVGIVTAHVTSRSSPAAGRSQVTIQNASSVVLLQQDLVVGHRSHTDGVCGLILYHTFQAQWTLPSVCHKKAWPYK